MIRPITCKCKAALGWFDSLTGCVVKPALPEGIMVWGLWFVCGQCGRRYKFDGLRVRKKERERDRKRSA